MGRLQVTLSAQVSGSVNATSTVTRGLTASLTEHPLSFSVNVGDCSVVWSDRRTVPSGGADDINLASAGFAAVKLLCVRNLSTTSAIAMSAGWDGSEFRNFLIDTAAWNFSPLINLGSGTFRGYPIRPAGDFMLSCPNSAGFATTVGGSTIRVGGPAGTSYEIYVMGT